MQRLLLLLPFAMLAWRAACAQRSSRQRQAMPLICPEAEEQARARSERRVVRM